MTRTATSAVAAAIALSDADDKRVVVPFIDRLKDEDERHPRRRRAYARILKDARASSR